MPKLPKNLLIVASADGSPAEISVRGEIGESWDMDEYTMTNTEEEVINALAGIPKGTKINLRVNSVGGNVGYAFGIYNALKRRSADISCFNEGMACSAASVLMCAGSRAIMPKSSVLMIHCASNYAYGNAEDMQKNIELLNTFDKSLAAVYAAKTGKPVEKILEMMKAETWMTGDEAKENGFADESNDDDAVFDAATSKVVAKFKKAPENLRSRLVTASATKTPTNKQTMKLVITALVALGITVSADATEEQVVAALNEGVNKIKTERDGSKTENEKHVTALKLRVENRVKAAIDAKKVKAERKDALIAIGVKNESDLDFLEDINTAPVNNGKARGANPAPAGEVEDSVEDEIAALREANRSERDPKKLSANSRRLRELRGHKDLFAEPAQN